MSGIFVEANRHGWNRETASPEASLRVESYSRCGDPGREPTCQCSWRCCLGGRLDLRQLLAERAQGHLQVVINLQVEPLLRRGAERLD